MASEQSTIHPMGHLGIATAGSKPYGAFGDVLNVANDASEYRNNDAGRWGVLSQ